MCGWIYAVFTSAFCWATADTLFDVILPSKTTALPTSTKLIDHLTHAQTMLLCAITTYIIVLNTYNI